jgi:hypothetical protein
MNSRLSKRRIVPGRKGCWRLPIWSLMGSYPSTRSRPLPGAPTIGVSTPGVPGPTSKLSTRAPAQMGRRETEHEGGGKETGKRGNPRPSCCPAPRSGALAVGGYKRPRGREREAYTRHPVLPRGQPSRTRALDLPFIGVRRGTRCTIGDVAVC